MNSPSQSTTSTTQAIALTRFIHKLNHIKTLLKREQGTSDQGTAGNTARLRKVFGPDKQRSRGALEQRSRGERELELIRAVLGTGAKGSGFIYIFGFVTTHLGLL
ncbi:MAG: hypothetical protein AB4426_21865 [Xenococcaceae cyanobacterium]